jgi:alpha-glucosidase
MLMTLLLSQRGAICVYQGEELGLTEAALEFEHLRDPFGIAYYPEFRGRDGSRTPMPWDHGMAHAGFTAGEPWLPVPPDHYAASVAAQERDPRSILSAWRRLVTWRRAHPALGQGDLRLLDLPAPLLGFTRSCAAESLLLVFNPSDRPVRLALGAFTGRALPLEDHGLAMLSEDAVAMLPPFGMFLAALEPAATVRQDARRAAAG